MRTPPRSVRIPDAIWQAAKARADAEGTTLTAVILRALTRYAAGAKFKVTLPIEPSSVDWDNMSLAEIRERES